MILPAVVFEMNGQSDGDSPGDFGSPGGESVNGSPNEGDDEVDEGDLLFG
jgi:hypothetical protein